MTPSPHAAPPPLADAVAEAAPRVAAVVAGRACTSGLLRPGGLVVTAEEPLPEDAAFEVILHGGERRAAREVGRDPSTDLVLLRIEGDAPEASATVRGEARVGDPVIVLGARGGRPLAAAGIVSFAGPAWRSLRGGAIDARIELDLDLPPGGEGALVLGEGGAALGMAVLGPRGRALVIPIATIERIAPRLEAEGRIARGYVGLGLQPVALDGGGRGLLVVNVAEGGPGDRAGIRQGDVVTELDGEAVRGMRGLMGALGPDRVGTGATLGLRRGGEPREVVVAIAERPRG